LHDALRDEHQRTDETERQQDPQRATDEIDPEIAKRVLLFLRDPADEGDRERNAGRGLD
jgi:hypothetical protein